MLIPVSSNSQDIEFFSVFKLGSDLIEIKNQWGY